jgi:hypothetical protein
MLTLSLTVMKGKTNEETIDLYVLLAHEIASCSVGASLLCL